LFGTCKPPILAVYIHTIWGLSRGHDDAIYALSDIPSAAKTRNFP